MPMIRAFAAILLPEDYQNGLADLIRRCGPAAPGRLGWTRPRSWHLTLKFLGDVPENASGGPADIGAVIEALADVSFAPFSLRGAGAGYFPDAVSPRVVWTGIEEGKMECAELAGRIDGALAPLGFAKERRPFSPHLTLARVRDAGARQARQARRDGKAKRNESAGQERSRPAKIADGGVASCVPGEPVARAAPDWAGFAKTLGACEWPAFFVTGFTLFQSVLGPGGPAYSSLAEFPARG